MVDDGDIAVIGRQGHLNAAMRDQDHRLGIGTLLQDDRAAGKRAQRATIKKLRHIR